MHKRFLLLPLVGILLVGCGNDNDYKFDEISNLDEISAKKEVVMPADSMMFYFGAMQAHNYLQDATSDTMLMDEDAREEFLRGFRAALALDDEASSYNRGLQLGLRLALRLNEFKERYGEDFSGDILAASMQHFLNNPDEVDILSSQKGFYNIKDRLETKAAQKDVESAKSNLAKYGKEMGFSMVSDTLYAKDVTPKGDGPTFKDGDRVAVEVTASTLDGEEIVTRQFPDSITIGEGRVPRVVCLGIHTMTDGQTRQFMTTPRTLMGKRLRIYNLDPETPVIFTVKVEQN